MHPVTLLSLCFVGGVVVAPWAGAGPWSPMLLATLMAALPLRRLRLPCGLVVALLAGIAVARSVPRGPVLRGETVVLGTRVGAATGRVADVVVHRHKAVGGPWVGAEGRVRVDFGQRPPAAGTVVLLQGTSRALGSRGLPGAPDDRVAAARVGVRSRLRARRWRPVGAEPDWTPPEHDPTGMLAALALGDRGGVHPDTTALLRRTGTSHLLAISGFHVGVVALLAGALAGVVRRSVALWHPVGLPPVELAAGVVAAALYAVAAHAPLSAQRAAGLLLLGALGRASGRTVLAEPLLGLVAVAVLWHDPAAVATPSFQLSFGAVVGLVRLGEPLQRRLPSGRLRWLSSGVAATVAATAGTFPAAAWWFQELAVLSPLANVVALPITSAVLVPAAGVATFGPPPLAGWASVVGTEAAEWMLWLLQPLAVAPLQPAVGPVGCGVLWGALAVARSWPRLAGLLVVLSLGVRPVPRVDTVTFLSVGQGDATLVEHADGRRWLVDGGPAGAGVAAWLRRRGVRRLDRVVVTHNQADHAAGLLAVVQTLRVGGLEVSGHDGLAVLHDAARQRGVPLRMAEGLHPAPDFVGSSNDRSVVLSVHDVLLTGDIEAAGEAVVASRAGGHGVLKVPHHGSGTSSSVDLLDAVCAHTAVLSVGANNAYGHPRDDVLRRYLRRGTRVLRTDRHGTLVRRGARWWGWRQGTGWTALDPSGDRPLDACTQLLASRRPPPADPEHDGGEGGQQQGEALGEGEQLAQQLGEEPAALGVATEGLEHGPGDGIQREVQPHHLPVEAPVPVEQVDPDGDAEQGDRLVQLHRVQRQVVGRQRGLGKGHSPWSIARKAVAAARRVAAHAADAVGQGEGGGHGVPDGEGGQRPPAHQREAQGEAHDEGAVEHQAPSADVEQVGEGVDGGGVLGDEHGSGTEQRQHREPEHQVGAALDGHAEAVVAPHHQGRTHQEGDPAEEAVGVDLEATEVEQDRVHGAG
jgi:competence protein ComEC